MEYEDFTCHPSPDTITHSLASTTLEEILASEERWEVVRVADRTKTPWWVCMHTAIAAMVIAVGTSPKEWHKMVKNKGSCGFAITTSKCK